MWDRMLIHRSTHDLVGQLLQFVWPFIQNLVSTAEPTRDHRSNWYSFQGHQGTQISHHDKEQHLRSPGFVTLPNRNDIPRYDLKQFRNRQGSSWPWSWSGMLGKTSLFRAAWLKGLKNDDDDDDDDVAHIVLDWINFLIFFLFLRFWKK